MTSDSVPTPLAPNPVTPPPPPVQSGPAGRGIGDVVAGRYRITGVVGKGAMGAVFAAEHTITAQKVALKFMIVGDEEGQEFIARFEQEAKVMAGLRSSNTIRIYDFGHTDDGALFMAMELLVGKPLDKHIRDLARENQTMTERDAGQLTVQMLRSLGEAHGLGLVHRDMKPGNVFLNDDGSGDTMAKVLDFGLARVSNSALTNVGRIMGTPAYMAPEQWQGSNVGPQADLYAVGCMMYAMVTAEPPFQAGDNVLSLMHKHCSEDIPDPREKAKFPLSEGFVSIMRTAMAKKAADRFEDAKSMRNAIEAVLGGSWNSSMNLGTSTQLTVKNGSNVGGGPEGGTAEQATIAADSAVVLRQNQSHKSNIASRAPSGDQTIAVVRPPSQVNIGQAPLSAEGQAHSKGKPWAAIAIAAVGIIAVAAWLATRGGPTSAPPAPAAVTPQPAVAAPAPTAQPASAGQPAAPTAQAPAAPQPAATQPTAAQPAVPQAVPAQPAPEAVPAPVAQPAAPTPAAVAKPKAAKAPVKKKANTLETVD